MTLSWEETGHLLKVVAAKDRRTVGRADIDFWYFAAQQAGWPSFKFAVAAIVRHTNERPGVWLEPGHITAYQQHVRDQAFNSWTPPTPPDSIIDDNKASQQYAKEDFQRVLEAAQANFILGGGPPLPEPGSTADRVAQIERFKSKRYIVE